MFTLKDTQEAITNVKVQLAVVRAGEGATARRLVLEWHPGAETNKRFVLLEEGEKACPPVYRADLLPIWAMFDEVQQVAEAARLKRKK